MTAPHPLHIISPNDQVNNLASKGVIFTAEERTQAECFFVNYSHFKVNYHRQHFQIKN
jgi:hypothetical protein